MYSELLARRMDPYLGNEGREYVSHIVRGADRMRQLLDDLLTYSGVGAKASEQSTEFGFHDIVASAIENLHAAIEKSGARVVFGSLPGVVGQFNQLTLLLQNLIANAIKFRRQDPPLIEITCERDGEYWRFRVKDNGIGFEEKYSEQIFHMFKRLHGTSQYPGTGIGLARCKKIVALHGGRMWAESRLDEGSSFYFTLPVAKISHESTFQSKVAS